MTDPKSIVDMPLVSFRFKDGENYKMLDPIPPDNIISFSYEDTVATGSDKFTCELFDPTWSEIEDLIISRFNNIEFRFGWVNGRQSAWRKAHILSHAPTFEQHGLRIALEGFDEVILANNEAKTRSWFLTNYQGRPDNIVRAIAAENEWNTDAYSVLNTKIVLYEDGGPKIFVQRQKPDLTFIVDDLLPYAETPEDIGDFRCWYDPNEGENKLYFRPPELDANVLKTYIVFKDQQGQVLSFTPDLGDGSLQRMSGALNTRMIGVDPIKKQVFDVVVDNKESTSQKILTGSHMAEQDIKTTQGAGRFMHATAHTNDSATQLARQRWFQRFNTFFTAEMEILGDPSVAAGKIIAVIVLDSKNNPLYFSGKYYVNSVIHTIDNGNYTSRLVMWKNSMDDGAVQVQEKWGIVKNDYDILTLAQMNPEEQMQAVVNSIIWNPVGSTSGR